MSLILQLMQLDHIFSCLLKDRCLRSVVFIGMTWNCIVPSVLFWFRWTQIAKVNNIKVSKSFYVPFTNYILNDIPSFLF